MRHLFNWDNQLHINHKGATLNLLMIRCLLWFCWVSGISFGKKKKKNFSRLVYKEKQSVTSRKMSWRLGFTEVAFLAIFTMITKTCYQSYFDGFTCLKSRTGNKNVFYRHVTKNETESQILYFRRFIYKYFQVEPKKNSTAFEK